MELSFDAVFDIETCAWVDALPGDPIGFLCGALLTADGECRVYDWKRESEFVDALLGLSKDGEIVQVWSHNGGRFDLLWLLDHLARREVSVRVSPSGSSVVRIEVGNIVFCDSKALFKLSLKDFTAANGVSKGTTGIPCRCGVSEGKPCLKACACEGTLKRSCGGYCQFSRSMKSSWLKGVKDYCVLDCRSLLSACEAAKSYSETNGISLGLTVGASAWKTARSWLDLPKADLTFQEHERAREGYYGGRCQVFRPEIATGHAYDVNSMYPWALRELTLPMGKHRIVIGQAARDAALKGAPGIYRADVDVQPCFVPPLPARCHDRIAYPVGKFSGAWALPEIERADECGAKIRITGGIVWERSENVFRPWADRLFALRAGAGKSSALGVWLKFLLNSLTGKLGAKPEHDAIDFRPETRKMCRRDCPPDCNGACGAHVRLAPNIYIRTVHRLEPNSHVAWAAYLTSFARVELHRQLCATPSPGYCDTDSVYSVDEIARRIGNELGEWKEEGKFIDFVAPAPKMHAHRSLDPETGKWELSVKAKGFRLGADVKKSLEAILAGRAVGGQPTVQGFRTGTKSGSFFKVRRDYRSTTGGYGDRIRDGDVTRAPTVEELKW